MKLYRLLTIASSRLRLTKASDPLFGPLAQSSAERNIGDQMLDWKRFANTLKLKMLVRTANNRGSSHYR